jgi:Chaperone of endosialidase
MRNLLVFAFLFIVLLTLQANAQAIVLPCVPMGNSCVPVSAANPLPTTGTSGAVSIDAGGATTITNGTNNAILYENGSGTVAALGNFIYSSGNNNLFFGPNTGNISVTGTDNMAFGIGAGASLTIPAMGANPQANTLIGLNAGTLMTTARESTCIGFDACASFTGSGAGIEDGLLTCIGSFACSSMISPAEDNVGIGQKAGLNATTGISNTFVGTHSAASVTTGSHIVVVGHGFDNGGTPALTGSGNVGIGDPVGNLMTGASSSNVIVGSNAALGTIAYTVSGLTIVGASAGQNIQSTVTNTTLVGLQAGFRITSGVLTALGTASAINLTTGTGDVCIGVSSCNAVVTGNYNINLGNNSGSHLASSASNQFIAGADGDGGSDKITDVYFGAGNVSALPIAYTIHGTGGLGTDITGADVTIGGGIGTGAGLGGKVHIQTALHSTTGTGLNTLADALVVDETKLVTLPAITSDAALTDTTVCQDTTNHGLRAGSGTAGICLGNVSSIRFKEAWSPLDDGLSVIMALNPGTWRYKSGVADGGARLQVGFLAEEYVRALPDWTRYDEQDRPNGVDLLAVLPQAVRAIQQLKADNDNLRADFDKLRRSVVR